MPLALVCLLTLDFFASALRVRTSRERVNESCLVFVGRSSHPSDDSELGSASPSHYTLDLTAKKFHERVGHVVDEEMSAIDHFERKPAKSVQPPGL